MDVLTGDGGKVVDRVLRFRSLLLRKDVCWLRICLIKARGLIRWIFLPFIPQEH